MPRYGKLEPPSEFILHEITYDEMKMDRGRQVQRKGWIAEHKTRSEVRSPEYSRRAVAIDWAWKWVGQQQARQREERRVQRRERRAGAPTAGEGAGATTER